MDFMRCPGILGCVAAACLATGCSLVSPGLSLSDVEADARARGAGIDIVTNDLCLGPIVVTRLSTWVPSVDFTHAVLNYIVISDRCYQVTANADRLRRSIDPSRARSALAATNNPWMLANLACTIVQLYDPRMRTVYPMEALGDEAARVWPFGDPTVRTEARGTRFEFYSARYDGSVDRVVVLFDREYRIAQTKISRADEAPLDERRPIF